MKLNLRNQASKILVIGDAMLDAYWLGNVSRISPEAPVPVLAVNKKTKVAGGAANVALNCFSLGAKVELVAVVGADTAAQDLKNCLIQNGVENLALVADTSRPTTVKTRIVAAGQQIVRIDEEKSEPVARETEAQLISQSLLALKNNPSVVVISDYGKGVVTQKLCKEVITAARAVAIPVLIDPKGSNYSKYSGATVISPNKTELAQATGVAASCVENLITEGQRLCEKLQVEHVVFTRSEEGISLLSSTEHHQFPATALEVVDVCGAGDAVISALAVGLSQGMSTKEAVWLGNAAGGLAVQKFGTAAITLSELESECSRLLGTNEPRGKVKSLQSLQATLNAWRSCGEKIVFTNGCFDLFHVGHLKLLESCKAQGTKLIVGVNSDSSVTRLKGPQRPVVPHEQRVQVLAGLEAVDAVVIFEEDTPLKLIESVKPDILAKGGDYTEETVVGAAFVRSYGGEVKLIPLVDGISTSALVNRIAQRHTGAML